MCATERETTLTSPPPPVSTPAPSPPTPTPPTVPTPPSEVDLSNIFDEEQQEGNAKSSYIYAQYVTKVLVQHAISAVAMAAASPALTAATAKSTVPKTPSTRATAAFARGRSTRASTAPALTTSGDATESGTAATDQTSTCVKVGAYVVVTLLDVQCAVQCTRTRVCALLPTPPHSPHPVL